MIYLHIRTDNLFRVVRKYERKNAYLVAIISDDDPLPYHMYYALEERHCRPILKK